MRMWILLLEAGVALFLLVFIVWWTMSGKKPDQINTSDRADAKADAPNRPEQK